MPTYDVVVIPVVLVFAGMAAWGDLRPMLPHLAGRAGYATATHGRIPNRLLLAWFVFAVLALAGGVGWVAAGLEFPVAAQVARTEGMPYVVALLLNGFLSLVLGVTLWLLGLWAAGDAKVFALLGLSLPLSCYSENYLPWFPGFALFFNTFVAMFLVLLLEFVGQTAWATGVSRGGLVRDGLARLWRKTRENRILVFKLLLIFLALFTTVRILRHFVRVGIEQYIELNKTVVYVVLFLMFRPIMRLAQKKAALLVAAAIIVGYAVYALFFDPTGEALYEFINIGWLAASIILFRFAYDAYLKATDEVAVSPSTLKPGMILGDTTLARLKERQQFVKERLGELAPDGLSADQVDALQEWYQKNDPDGSIYVSRTIPFAPALFIGAVLTVIAHGLVVVF